MRKILVIILSLFLLVLSYQVRLGYLQTYDFNEPSDAGEYANGRSLKLYIIDVFNGKIPFPFVTKHVIGAFNVHGVPLYSAYQTLLSFFNSDAKMAAPVTNSFLVVFLFLASLKFLPLWISLVVGIIAAFYTPLFTAIYSWMPENFTTVFIPIFVMLASLLIVKAKNWKAHLLAGIILALTGFARNVFLFYGGFFIAIYLLLSFKKLKRSNVISLVLGYVLPIFIWLLLVGWSGTSPYAQGTFQSTAFYANSLKTDGWTLDGIDVTWFGVIKNALLQNPISLLLLRLERITRFFKNPANAYSTSFPFSQDGLVLLHLTILFFATWGVRGIFKDKRLLFIFSAVAWNVFFVTSYYLEEVRLQAPTIGLVILLAGVGIKEYFHLLQSKQLRMPIVLVSSLFLGWVFLKSHILGLELAVFSFIKDAGIWRIVNMIGVTLFMIYVSKKLWKHDRKKISALIPFFIFVLILSVHLRSRIWHEWSTPLSIGQVIEQKIDLSGSQAEEWKKTKGYLLIDIKDVNSGYPLSVKLNGILLSERLPMYKMRSPVDMLAIRQWQKALPRLGWGHIEDQLREAPAWPNMHQWLVFPFKGDILKNNNTIIVKNTNYFSSSMPIIFGDYLPFNDRKYYEGPDARLFQGYKHFNKYQIDGDFRLNQKLPLLSKKNISSLRLVDGQILIDDLSLVLGKQTGRYRIFLLFGADPIYLF